MDGLDHTRPLQEQVREAFASRTPLRIVGGGSKAFYGRQVEGQALVVTAHAGIVSHAPTELVITARGGTPLADVEAVLAAAGQMLPFEPPHFSGGSTFGGMLAAGLAGPRRLAAGSVRDALLGVKLLTGRGEVLTFGGQVMKNVAGYDVSRLLAGSLGSLGVILEASVKVLPRPAKEITLVQTCDETTALARLTQWQSQPWPISASLFDGERLWLRLSGAHAGVNAARAAIGGEVLDEHDNTLWPALRDHRLPFFSAPGPLWRIAVPPATPLLPLSGTGLVEWGGAQRWLRSDEPAARIRAVVAEAGGHATLFRGHDGTGAVFQPLPAPLLALQQRVKATFDPAGILNPGVLYAGL